MSGENVVAVKSLEFAKRIVKLYQYLCDDNGVTPLRTAANGKPPIPSKRLPIVIISTYPLP